MRIQQVCISLLFVFMPLVASAFQIAEKPLRTLNPQSEIYVPISNDLNSLVAGANYQNGKQALFGIDLDETKSYCRISDTSIVPSFKERDVPLALISIDGSIVDQNPVTFGSGNFWTKMHFSSGTGTAELFVECFNPSKGQFYEATFSDFNRAFGKLIRFGNLNLADEGLVINSLLYPEHDVLEPKQLRENILLETTIEILLKAQEGSQWSKAEVIDGSITYENDFSQPYCGLFVIGEPGTTSMDITIPAKTKLRISGDVVGSYTKQYGDLSFGFTTMVDLAGFTHPIRMSCTSLNANKPIRYTNLREILGSALSVFYSN